MARPKSPDGRSVAKGARFSEAEAAEIDAARGGADWSSWLRMAALTVARGLVVDGAPVPVNGNAAGTAGTARQEVPVNVNPVPVYVNEPEPERVPCRGGRHPSGAIDMNLGICRECGTELD